MTTLLPPGRHGPPSRTDMLQIARHVLRALDYQHAAGDIEYYCDGRRKPALMRFNLMSLAGAASTSKETIYLYWRSKEELLRDLVADGCADVRQALRDDARSPYDFRAVGVVNAALLYARRVPYALHDPTADVPPEVRRMMAATIGRLRAAARRAARQGITARQVPGGIALPREGLDRASADAWGLMLAAAVSAPCRNRQETIFATLQFLR